MKLEEMALLGISERDRVCNDALYEPLLPKGDKEEDLRQAIKDCDLEQIKRIADEGVDINAAYPGGMYKKDVEKVFKKLKLLFSEIRKRALPEEIVELSKDLSHSISLNHSEEYVKFSNANTTLRRGYDFSEKQPVEIVEEIVKNIDMALRMKSHYHSCWDLELNIPNTPASIAEVKPTIVKRFRALLKRDSARGEAKSQIDETINHSNAVTSESSSLYEKDPLAQLAHSEVASPPIPKSNESRLRRGKPRKPMIGG